MEKLRRSRAVDLPREIVSLSVLQRSDVRAAIAKECDLDFPRSVGRWIARAKLDRKFLTPFLSVIKDYDASTVPLIERLFGRPDAALSTDVEKRFAAAVRDLDQRPEESVGVILSSFREMLASSARADAIQRIPSVLYAVLRHSTATHLLSVINELIAPYFAEIGKRNIDPRVKVATLAMLTSAMNEYGRPVEALDTFQHIRDALPNRLEVDTEPFHWITLTTLRNEANAAIWSHKPAAARRTIDELAEDKSKGNKLALPNIRFELGIQEGKLDKAWDALEKGFSTEFEVLTANYDADTGLPRPYKTPLTRPLHQYATFVHGILAAGACGDRLSSEQLDNALTLAFHLGHRQLGRSLKVTAKGPMKKVDRERFEELEAATRRPGLNAARLAILLRLAESVRGMRS